MKNDLSGLVSFYTGFAKPVFGQLFHFGAFHASMPAGP